MDRYRFTLYIAGDTQRSRQAIANLERICQEVLPDCHEISVIDVVERPELAERDRILTTPTLVKAEPAPIRRITGDLSDAEQVLIGLGLQGQAPIRHREGSA